MAIAIETVTAEPIPFPERRASVLTPKGAAYVTARRLQRELMALDRSERLDLMTHVAEMLHEVWPA